MPPKRITRQCLTCNQDFYPLLKDVNQGRGHYCCRACQCVALFVPLEKRFWEKVQKTGNCWIWTGARVSAGYGCIRVDHKTLSVHRLSYELNIGPIPDGLWVLHKCDNPPCVNPDHLFLGTSIDNSRDRSSKGRTSKGSHRPNSVLTEGDVREIRRLVASGVSQKEVRAKYGIGSSTISMIVTRQRWKHVA